MRRLAVAEVREQVRAEAAAFAQAELKRLRKRFRRRLAAMPPKEREHLLRATEHFKERQYFDKVEQGARNRRRHLEAKLAGDPRNATLRAELRDARKVEDAAAVKPVEGRLPRNHEYAGTLYRVDVMDPIEHKEAIDLIKAKRRAGVHFNRQGFPDFTPWTYRQGDVAADVRIIYTGSRKADFRLADQAMRERLGDPRWARPSDYTWHHHEDIGRMILVPKSIHQSVAHTGGIPRYRMMTGSYNAY